MIPQWLLLLRAELDQKEPAEQIRVTGDWIVLISRTLLPELAEARRLTVAHLLDHPDWDAQRLAETIGSRRVAIDRLAKDGRRLREITDQNSAAG